MELYSHQKRIIADGKKKCGLFLGTGSAKTLTALHLARGRILVITPKLQKEEENFKREATKHGLDKDITSLSKEQFKKLAPTLGQFDTVIIDEMHTTAGATTAIHYYKKQPRPKCSQLFYAVIEYLQRCPPERLYGLTATPTRSPMCVWAIAKILGHDWDFYQFRETFYIKVKRGFREFFIPKSDIATKERLGQAVRNLGYTGQLSDYFDVPEQVYKVDYVDLTKHQTDALKGIVFEYPDPIVLIGKKHQIENGGVDGIEYPCKKIEKILDYALEFPKMVIFAKYTAQIERIRKALKAEGYDVAVLQGDTKDRAQVIKDSEMSDKKILIIQSQISAGYELPSFPVVIFASMSYSVVDFLQSCGRVLRANKLKHNLYIHLVVRQGVDNAVYKSIINKQDFSEHIYAKA